MGKAGCCHARACFTPVLELVMKGLGVYPASWVCDEKTQRCCGTFSLLGWKIENAAVCYFIA